MGLGARHMWVQVSEWLWASSLTSLSLSFLFSVSGRLVHSLPSCYEIEMRYGSKMLYVICDF